MRALKNYIEESLYNYTSVIDDSIINERHGIPEEIRQIIYNISDKINNDEPNIKDKYECHFQQYKINNIYLVLKHESYIEASYLYEKTNYDNRTIYIEAKWDFDYYKSIEKLFQLILHELVHAYEDFSRYDDNDILLKYLNDDKYKKSYNNINNTNKYKKIISRLIYFFNETERNAYISRLESDIESIINKHNDWNKIYHDTKLFISELKNIDIWKSYFEFDDILYKVQIDKHYCDLLRYAYNDMFNDNKSNKDIINIIKVKFNKFKNKFEQLVPKIFFEKLPDNNDRTISFDISLLN